MKILVTGGVGYIGSHTCIELLKAGHDVVVVDNLSNSTREALVRVEEITGRSCVFHEVDLRNKDDLDQVFLDTPDVDCVIHFAGLKAVGESVAEPLLYYSNNIGATVTLCQSMKEYGVKNLIFSSSATVYGDPATVPIKEEFPLSCTNPYGRTKLMIEEILTDLCAAEEGWSIVLLRYFNPVGAHESGRIGENPQGIPNNLMPYVSQVAVGKLQELSIYGGDYPTKDGTGVRDYIHVVDLAQGHVKALAKTGEGQGVSVYNLGTGRGYSVLEMVKAFSDACGRPVPHSIVDRRPGDIAECFADPAKAEKELGWRAVKGLEDMCNDTWRWQKNNPTGF